jgi:hypothetical protein
VIPTFIDCVVAPVDQRYEENPGPALSVVVVPGQINWLAPRFAAGGAITTMLLHRLTWLDSPSLTIS